MRRAAIGWALAALLPCSTAWSGEIVSGRPTVIDGDTLRLGDMVIGLSGIVAPSLDQTCENRAGRIVPCGRQAARTLSERIGEASIACETRGLDGSQRMLAVCRMGDEDLNGWMVSSGLAVSERFSDATYFSNETKAWAKRLGLWAGVFVDPTGRTRSVDVVAAKPSVAMGDAAQRKRTDVAPALRLMTLAK